MKTPLCSVAEIPPDSAIKVDFFGREALVYLVDGRPRAIANVCMHIGGPLAQQGAQFVCAWHGATFSCRDGRKLSGPGRPDARLMTIPTRVEGGTLFYVWDEPAQGSPEGEA
jgi:nitrite reductase/ring-hydroxylating ferredoxin subunit